MLKRLREPWAIFCALTILSSSAVISFVLVRVLGWRYTDWLGLVAPFDEGWSFVAYTIFGFALWPIVALVLWLVIGDLYRNNNGTRRRE